MKDQSYKNLWDKLERTIELKELKNPGSRGQL